MVTLGQRTPVAVHAAVGLLPRLGGLAQAKLLVLEGMAAFREKCHARFTGR